MSTEDLIIARKGIALIIEAEGNYERPYWPGNVMSGVTVGIGYDFGHHTRQEIIRDWGRFLPAVIVDRLANLAGLKGDKARVALRKTQYIRIPLTTSARLFEEYDIPRWIRRTASAFPGYNNLPDEIQGALVSLVFNRGISMVSKLPIEERREMLAIRTVVASAVPLRIKQREIAAALRSMKRLWDGTLMAPYNVRFRGLITRRENEALLVESAA